MISLEMYRETLMSQATLNDSDVLCSGGSRLKGMPQKDLINIRKLWRKTSYSEGMFGSSQKWRRSIDRIDRETNHLFKVMHLSMLSRRGGRQGIGRGFDRHSWPVGRAFDRFSCPRGRIIWFFALRPWWGCFCHMVGRDWYPVDCSRFAHVM